MPLARIIHQAPYLRSRNLAVEVLAVTRSREGGFPGEWYRWPSLQGMEARCQSPSPVDKMAKIRLGKRSAGKLLLIHMELKFKQSCGRHVVHCDGVFVADMV